MAASSIDYLSLFRSLPGLYLLLAPDGTILDNSDEHVTASLLPREQAVGRNIFDAYPSAPESQQALRESHDYVRQHRRPHTMPVTRYDLQRPPEQGGGFEERYWQITHYPILDQRGELQFILQRPEDITEQHRAALRQQSIEQELADTKEQAEFILENLPLLLTITPPNGVSTYFNRRWREFTGRSLEELRYNRFMECMHPDDRERIAAWRDEQMRTPNETQVEFRLQRHDGTYRWMLAHSRAHFGPDGQLRVRVSTTVDIHDRKLLVQELLEASEQQAQLVDQAQQAKRLAESQRATFYNLFMQAPALISIVRGPEHRYEFINPPALQLLPNREMMGRTVAEAVPEAIEQGFVALLDRVYTTGETYYGNEVPLQLPGDNGELRELFFNFIYQRFSENGQPAGIMTFGFDVTDFVRARRNMEALLPPASSGATATE